MPRPTPTRCLRDKDLENLRASGLTDETIRDNRLYTESNSKRFAAILNRQPESSGRLIPLFCIAGGLVFPYYDLVENNGFHRVRPHSPRISKGKPVKYEQPLGEPSRAYFPKATRAKLREGGVRALYISEGEKKALALDQLGVAAVGIGGVWCWKKKDTDELIDDLTAVGWRDRDAYIVFDWDENPKTRRSTDWAARRLATALRKAGAREVYGVVLPPGPDGAKQGVDDFIVANGPEAFTELVKKARPVPSINDFHPLTRAEGRTDANNAARLGAKYGDVVRWVGPWDKWLIWDGTRWKMDRSLAIELKAKEIGADLFGEIGAALRENQK